MADLESQVLNSDRSGGDHGGYLIFPRDPETGSLGRPFVLFGVGFAFLAALIALGFLVEQISL